MQEGLNLFIVPVKMNYFLLIGLVFSFQYLQRSNKHSFSCNYLKWVKFWSCTAWFNNPHSNYKKKNDEKLCSDTLSLLEHRCSGWLLVLPSTENEFCMNADEYRDSIALRYGRIPKNLPPLCDADGEIFDVNHAFNCPRGGLVYRSHNFGAHYMWYWYIVVVRMDFMLIGE